MSKNNQQKPMNIEDLRESLLDDFVGMKTGEVAIPLGKARTATARTVVSSAKAEMDYNKQVGEADKRIPFLETA